MQLLFDHILKYSAWRLPFNEPFVGKVRKAKFIWSEFLFKIPIPLHCIDKIGKIWDESKLEICCDNLCKLWAEFIISTCKKSVLPWNSSNCISIICLYWCVPNQDDSMHVIMTDCCATIYKLIGFYSILLVGAISEAKTFCPVCSLLYGRVRQFLITFTEALTCSFVSSQIKGYPLGRISRSVACSSFYFL